MYIIFFTSAPSKNSSVSSIQSTQSNGSSAIETNETKIPLALNDIAGSFQKALTQFEKAFEGQQEGSGIEFLQKKILNELKAGRYSRQPLLILDLKGIDFSEFSAEQIAQILLILNKNRTFNNFQLIYPDNIQEDLRLALTKIEIAGIEIAARNYWLNQKLVPITNLEDPWQDLMSYMLQHATGGYKQGSDTEDYFNRSDPNLVFKGDHFDLGFILKELGKEGLKAFLKNCFRIAVLENREIYKTLLVYTTHISDRYRRSGYHDNDLLSLNEFFDICVEVQAEIQEENKGELLPFPFKEIRVRGRDSKTTFLNEGLQEKIIQFANQNRHITKIQLDCDVEDKSEPEEQFRVKLKEQMVSAVITLTNWDSQIIENVVLENRQKLAQIKDKEPEKKKASAFVEDIKIPESWNQARPLHNKNKLNVHYEYNLEHSLETTSSIDTNLTFSTQRMQQIQNQLLQQQQLQDQATITIDNIYIGSCVSRDKFQQDLFIHLEEAESYNLYAFIHKYIFGRTEKIIDDITVSAAKVIVANMGAFKGGLMLQNLPIGFYILERGDRKILCYDCNQNKDRKQDPLTVKLRHTPDSSIEKGTYERFCKNKNLDTENTIKKAFNIFIKPANDDSFDSKFFHGAYNPRSWLDDGLYILLRFGYGQSEEQNFIKNYDNLLASFSYYNVRALTPVFLNQGLEGLNELLTRLKLLQDEGLLVSFKKAFMDSLPNYTELTSNQAHLAMDALLQLTPNQQLWWNEFTKQAAETEPATYINFLDCINAFKYFIAKLKKLNPPIFDLPETCKVQDVRNVQVALDRLLYILKNAANPQEQLSNLENVSLDQEGAYHSTRNSGFNFVSGEMELTWNEEISENSTDWPFCKVMKNNFYDRYQNHRFLDNLRGWMKSEIPKGLSYKVDEGTLLATAQMDCDFLLISSLPHHLNYNDLPGKSNAAFVLIGSINQPIGFVYIDKLLKTCTFILTNDIEDHHPKFEALKKDILELKNLNKGEKSKCIIEELTSEQLEKITKVTSFTPDVKAEKNPFKRYFYRYLGSQRFLYPFEIYRTIFSMVNASKLDEKIKSRFLTLIAIATTEERSFHTYNDPKTIIARLLNTLNDINSPKDALFILDTLGEICKHGAKPDLDETEAIFNLLIKNFSKEDSINKELSASLVSVVKDYSHPALGIRALASLGANNTILPQDFCNIAKAVAKTVSLQTGDSVETREKAKLEHEKKVEIKNEKGKEKVYGNEQAKESWNKGKEKENLEKTERNKTSNAAKGNNEFIAKTLAALSGLNLTGTDEREAIVAFQRYIPLATDALTNIIDVLLEIDVSKSNELPPLEIVKQFFHEMQEKSSGGANFKLSKPYIREELITKYSTIRFLPEIVNHNYNDCLQELIGILNELKIELLKNSNTIETKDNDENKIFNEIDEIIETLRQPNHLNSSGGLQLVKNLIEKLGSDAGKSATLVLIFSAACKASIVNAVNKLKLNNKTTHSLIVQLNQYMGNTHELEKIDTFFFQYDEVKKLLDLLLKTKDTLNLEGIVKNISAQFSIYLEEEPLACKNIISFITKVLENKKFTSKQKTAIFKAFIASPDLELINALCIINKFGATMLDSLLNAWAAQDEQEIKNEKSKVTLVDKAKNICNITNELLENLSKLSCLIVSPMTFVQTLLKVFGTSNDYKTFVTCLNEINNISIVNIIYSLLQSSTNLNISELPNILQGFIEEFSKLSEIEQKDIAVLYQRKSYPTLDEIIKDLKAKKPVNEIINDLEEKQLARRNIDQQLKFGRNTKKTTRAIANGINDLQRKERINRNQSDSLFIRFHLMNELGKELAGANAPRATMPELLMQMNEIKQHLNANKAVNLNDNSKLSQLINELINRMDPAEKDYLRSKFILDPKKFYRTLLLAYLREIYYRTSIDNDGKGIFINAMQMISILHTMDQSKNLISGIDTGEGKTFVCALQAVLLWCEGHTVDVCSWAFTKAEEDFETVKPFFHCLGAQTALIKQDSDIGSYHQGGVHYSDPSNLALYRSRCVIEGGDAGKDAEEENPLSLILDEIDDIILDNASTQFILTRATMETSESSESIDYWVYPLVNQFADYLIYLREKRQGLNSALPDGGESIQQAFARQNFIEIPYTVAEEVKALKAYLLNNSPPDTAQQRISDPKIIPQLNTWIFSGLAACQSQEGIDYIVDNKKEHQLENGDIKECSEAIILEKGFPKFGAVWSDGVQQCLHARLNNILGEGQPAFRIEPERKAISTTNIRNLIDRWYRFGRVLGNTASPGSSTELAELYHRYGFDVFQFPPQTSSNLSSLENIYATTVAEEITKIRKAILKAKGQPVLIGCQNIKTAEEIAKIFQPLELKGYRVNLLTAKNVEQEKRVIRDAGKNFHITISTISKRGTDIKVEHKKGLLVFATNDDMLSTQREKKQVDGRAARQGQQGSAQSAYNDETLARQHGITLKNASEKERKQRIANLQQHMDKDKKRGRDRIVYEPSEILHAIQLQLDKYYLQLKETGDDEGANKVLIIKQDSIEKTTKALGDLFELGWQDISHDKHHRIFHKQMLNRVMSDFIDKAEKIWQQTQNELEPLFEDMQEEKEKEKEIEITIEEDMGREDGKVNGFRRIDFFELINVRKKLVILSSSAASDSTADIKQTHFTRSVELYKKAKTGPLHALPQFMSQLTSTKANAVYLRDILDYQQQNQVKEFKEAINIANKACEDYVKLFWVANDRKEIVTQNLLPFLKGLSMSTINSDLVGQLSRNLNKAFYQSLQDDRNNNESNIFKRSAPSRFRDRLLKIKEHLYAVYFSQELKAIFHIELTYLSKYLTAEQEKPFYETKPELKKHLHELNEKLSKILPQDAEVSVPNEEGSRKGDEVDLTMLSTALFHFDAIVTHSDYIEKECALAGVRENLNYLFERALNVLATDDKKSYDIYYGLRRKLLAGTGDKNSSPFSFFNSKRYQLPENSIFDDLLKDIFPGKYKYNLYRLVSTVRDFMSKKGAFNIEFSFADEAKIHIIYELIDNQHKSKAYEMSLNLDFKNNHCLLEYVGEAPLPMLHQQNQCHH